MICNISQTLMEDIFFGFMYHFKEVYFCRDKFFEILLMIYVLNFTLLLNLNKEVNLNR